MDSNSTYTLTPSVHKDLPPVLLCDPVSMVFVKIRIFLLQSHFGRGAYIVRQGAAGDTFYIISEGKVKVTQKKEGKWGSLRKEETL